MQTVNFKMVNIALDRVSGTDFEQFFHAFYPALSDINFVPLGGIHDGGADAFHGERLFEGKSHKPETFYQASIEEDCLSKIRRTAKRLQEFGRKPKVLVYVTSRIVKAIDKKEENLSNELDIIVKIRDKNWIVSNINDSPQTVEAFRTYLQPHISFLDKFGGATTVGDSPNIETRTLCVFLGQEIDRRRGNTDLLMAITDSLILWALEGTDPDANKFLTRKEILSRIEIALPSARHFVHKVFGRRLEKMASRRNPTGREIRWYKNEDKFCLPYETRKIVVQENIEDESLKGKVLNLYEQRAAEILDVDKSSEKSLRSVLIAKLAHRTLEMTFEREGLGLVKFLTREQGENHNLTISDQADAAIEETDLTGEYRVAAKETVLAVLRQAFYNSTKTERVYYGKLSRTYTLMLSLRNEPKIIEYFRGMSSNFTLFVGSDIIVRALSERYLPAEDQMTVNMLRILRSAGSTLTLTHMTVEEIHAHIKGTNSEFQSYFHQIEPYVGKEIVRHADKILIRTYFNEKFNPLSGRRSPEWKSFIGQICNYDDLYNATVSRNQIKNYLIEKFDFEYMDKTEMGEIFDENEARELAYKIRPFKSEEVLALNDARHILAVYGKRRMLKEEHRPNPYGYRSWWLTQEEKVYWETRELVQSRGAEYIIRPEFILNFIALSPDTKDVRKSYDSIFPTILGIRLSNRMREDVFRDVMRRANAAFDMDPARAKAELMEMSNCLMGDNYKKYEVEFSSP